jgi:thiamine pyrophosphokinase
MRKKAILVGAAPFRSPEARSRLRKSLSQKNVIRIAVDGGLEIFRSLKVQPDLYVGDLDSVRRIPPQIPAVFLPHEKDYSDLRAALEICSEMRICHVEAWAVTGGRADHHWASIDELSSSLQDSSIDQLEAHGDDATFIWVTPSAPLKLKTAAGNVISLFNLRAASGVTTKGLAYNLASSELVSGSHGLSNFARVGTVQVSTRKGTVLVIIPSQS